MENIILLIMEVMKEIHSITVVYLKEFIQQLPECAKIVNSTVTGYGEALIKAALQSRYWRN